MSEPRSVTVPLFHQFCGWNVRGLIPRKICLTKDIDTNCAEFSVEKMEKKISKYVKYSVICSI